MPTNPSNIFNLTSLLKRTSREIPTPSETDYRTRIIMLQLSILRRLHAGIEDSDWAHDLVLELTEETQEEKRNAFQNVLNIAFQCKAGNMLLAIQFYELGKMEIVAFRNSEVNEDFKIIRTVRDNPFGLCAWLVGTGELLGQLPPYDDAGLYLINIGKAAEAIFNKVAGEDFLFAQYREGYDRYVELALGVGAPVLNIATLGP